MKKVTIITASILLLVFTILNEYLIYTWSDIDWSNNNKNMGVDLVMLGYPVAMALLVMVSLFCKGVLRVVCCFVSCAIGLIAVVFGLCLTPLMLLALHTNTELVHFLSIILCTIICLICVSRHLIFAVKSINTGTKKKFDET